MQCRQGKYNIMPDAVSRAPSDIGLTELPGQASLMPVGGVQELQKDPNTQKLYQSILDGGELTVNDTTKFSILEGKVYWMVQLPYKQIYQVCIPECLLEPLLEMLHEDPISGHLGRYKTYKRPQALVYWSGMGLAVKDYVQNCQTCQYFKPKNRLMARKLQQTGVTRAWEMLGVDLMGPFRHSTSGNLYLIAFVDYYIR